MSLVEGHPPIRGQHDGSPVQRDAGLTQDLEDPRRSRGVPDLGLDGIRDNGLPRVEFQNSGNRLTHLALREITFDRPADGALVTAECGCDIPQGSACEIDQEQDRPVHRDTPLHELLEKLLQIHVTSQNDESGALLHVFLQR